jgi:glycosyltransferase involved in cell wall biosynthesis
MADAMRSFGLRQAGGAEPGAEPLEKRCRKVLLLVTEDWFVLSHFRPLIDVLKRVALEVVVVTHFSGRSAEIEALGARTIDFDYHRRSSNPLRQGISALALARILEAENPDVVHLVAMKPAILGSLALVLVDVPRVVVHVTGMGTLGARTRGPFSLYRAGAMRLLASTLGDRNSFLLVENPDDLALLRESGVDPGARVAILGGAGVDPDVFPTMPAPRNELPVAAFVGRMISAKGVDVLMEAFEQLRKRNARLQLELYGAGDDGRADSIAPQTLERWCARTGARWLGVAKDVREVWRHADIFVLPSVYREGMPRAMLEAAACGRPLIVTDVPGCRHFVRDGTEGIIVPPGDATALTEALLRLARDPTLRVRMGEAARLRVLQGFTEAQLKQSVHAVYVSLLGASQVS